jgi:D-lactate dehydrogenase
VKAAIFSAHEFDCEALTNANQHLGHHLTFLKPRLDPTTAALGRGYPAVIVFVNDWLDAVTLETLKNGGTQLVALRCAGFNNVDLDAAKRLGLHVVHVPTYSPHSVAEHVFALLLALMRHIPQAYNRVRDHNFSVEGLIGFELHGRTFAIVGTGHIGQAVARIANGFGCKLVGFDLHPPLRDDTAPPITYIPLKELVAQADVISIHAPLTPQTFHLFNADLLARIKPSTILINTSRGALIDTTALITALEDERMGGVGLDVYELEERVFYRDLSDKVLTDDVLARLLSFKNVLVTGHMGFLTREALAEIAKETLDNLTAFDRREPLVGEIGLATPG